MGRQFSSLFGFIRRHIEDRDLGELPDGELLSRYVIHKDEQAFAVIVQRYGSIVLSVCRRVLRDADDVEDAFQATFVVLARRANSANLWSLGPWLHSVAYRVAARARATLLRRRAQESETMRVVEPESPNADADDLRPLLDEELQNLPRKCRESLVLCYLLGKTHEEASKELGYPKRSLDRYLGQGRELLRERLARRGVALASLAVAERLTQESIGAVVPVQLLEKAAAIAHAVATNASLTGAVSNNVILLADELLRSMWHARLRVAMLACLAIVALGGVATYAYQAVAQPGKPADPKGPFGLQSTWHLKPANEILTLALSPSGKMIAMAGVAEISVYSTGTEARHWDEKLADGEGSSKEEIEKAWSFGATMAFSDDDRRLAVLRQDKVQVYDADSGRELFSTPIAKRGFQPRRSFLAISSDGKHLALAGADAREFALWDIDRKSVTAITNGATVVNVAFAPSSSILALLGENGVIRLIDPGLGTEKLSIPKATGADSLRFSSDGTCLVAWGRYRPAAPRVWDTQSGALLASWSGEPVTLTAWVSRAIGT